MNRYLFLLMTVLLPLTGFTAQMNTMYVSKFQCSPANKMVLNLTTQYILNNPQIPQLPPPEKVIINKYYRVVSGQARGAVGTIAELAKLPGVDSQTGVEQVARVGDFNPSSENSFRIFRSFYDPKVCKPEAKDTCMWDDILNVYQDATMSSNGSMIALISNADGFTPDVTVIDLKTKKKMVIFTTGYHKPYENSGKAVGQVNFINDAQGNPRYLTYRDGGYKESKISITFFDLVTKEQVTIPREQIELIIGVTPDPIYASYVNMKTYYSVNVEKLLADVKNGTLATKDVSVPFRAAGQDFPQCAPFQLID